MTLEQLRNKLCELKAKDKTQQTGDIVIKFRKIKNTKKNMFYEGVL